MAAPASAACSMTPHLSVVLSNATTMAAVREYVTALVLEGGEKGFKTVGQQAAEPHGVARPVAKLKAEARRDGQGTAAKGTSAEITAAAQSAMAAGHDRPVFVGGEQVDVWIYTPFENAYKKDLAQKPIELEHLGNFLASDLLCNAPVALEGVLRRSHRKLEIPEIVADTFAQASPEAQYNFAVAIRPILVDILTLAPFSRASAEAGRADEAAPAVEGLRRGKRGIERQTESARAAVVEPPPLKMSDSNKKAFAEAVKMIKVDPKFVTACRELVTRVMRRLLAQRDVAFALGLEVEFLTVKQRDDLRAKYPKDESFVRKADDRFGEKMIAAYASAAPKGEGGTESWTTIATQPFAEMFDGLPEKVKLRSAGLILWTRFARGEYDEAIPSFSPNYVEMNVIGLLRVWDKANLRQFIGEVEALATVVYARLAPKMHKHGAEAALLKDLRRLFKPKASNWATLRTSAVAPSVELAVRPGVEDELNAVYETMQDAFGVLNPSGSKKSLSNLGGGQVELLHALVRQDVLPRNFIATASFKVSASDIVFFGVRHDLLKDKDKDNDLNAGEFFKEHVATTEWSQMKPSHYPAYQGVTEYVGDPVTGQLVPRRVFPFTSAGCVEAEQAQRDRPAPWQPRGAPRVRAGFAERHPATTTIEVKERTRTTRTRDGIPVNWVWAGGDDDNKRRAILSERAGTREEKHVKVGVDLGRVVPVAAFVSAGDFDSPSGRAESVVLMTNGALRQMDEETSRMRSRLGNWLGEGFKERLPLMDEEEEAARGDEGGGGKSAAHPLYDHDDMIVRATVVGLVAASSERSRQSRRQATRRKGYVQGVAAELARTCVGGRNAPTADEAHKTLVTVAVGSAATKREAGKGGGVDSGKVVLRQFEVELQSQGVRSQFVMTNEAYTSQHCPRPWCVDDEGRRSFVVHPKRADGSECLRVVYCPRCKGVFHRDGGAGANIYVNLDTQLVNREWLWRRDGGVEGAAAGGEGAG